MLSGRIRAVLGPHFKRIRHFLEHGVFKILCNEIIVLYNLFVSGRSKLVYSFVCFICVLGQLYSHVGDQKFMIGSYSVKACGLNMCD